MASAKAHGEKMIGIVFLIGLYFLGEFLAFLLNLPIPGSIVGLLLAIALLACAPNRTLPIREGAEVLLRLLPFFLVPIGVGLLSLFSQARFDVLVFSLVTLGALIIGVIITAVVMSLLFGVQTRFHGWRARGKQ